MERRPLEGRRDLKRERKENEGGNGRHVILAEGGTVCGNKESQQEGERGDREAGDGETIKTKYNNYMCENVIVNEAHRSAKQRLKGSGGCLRALALGQSTAPRDPRSP